MSAIVWLYGRAIRFEIDLSLNIDRRSGCSINWNLTPIIGLAILLQCTILSALRHFRHPEL